MTEQLLNVGADPHVEAKTRKDGEPFTAFDLALYSQFNDALKLMFSHVYADSNAKHPQLKESKSVPKVSFPLFIGIEGCLI